ncbi:class I adenylate-forming enzyme family protein [Streptomyces plumbiresistens]|uniref:Long-chain-fatty-acid--CoA ligase LcfB n=1 Tax=Streptomyces plumbiresistens TaxID=511811 RepID=A0ABP7SLT5_9ACTN
MTLHALFRARAEESPEAEAVIFGQKRISYGALASEVDRVARGLHAHGVLEGDRVLGLAGNTPDVIALYLAVGKLGAVYVPVSSGFREREGRFVLRNAEPKLAVVEAALLGEFLSWTDGRGPDLVVLGADNARRRELPAGAARFEEIGLGVADVPAAPVSEEAGLLLCYTSGTTSTPKPVLHSQRSEVYNARTYSTAWDLGPGDRGIVSLPLAWVYGLSTTTAALLVSGGTVVLLDRFHPADVLDAIEEHAATAMWGTMSMYTKLLEVIKERGKADLGSLRVVANGGEPCPPPLVRNFEEHTGITLLGTYATSEARPIVLVRPGDEKAPEGSVGQLVPGAEIRLEGPDGGEVEIGEPGHALLRCPGLMTAYYGEPELTADRITPDGWLKTGDILRRDSAGHYFVVGRESDLIIRSGVNIAPAEVEFALMSHPEIAEAAVVGIPDQRSGEAVLAFVVAERGALPGEDEIRHFLAEQVAAYKVPQRFVFVDDLPRTERGKLDRIALRTRGEDLSPQG